MVWPGLDIFGRLRHTNSEASKDINSLKELFAQAMGPHLPLSVTCSRERPPYSYQKSTYHILRSAPSPLHRPGLNGAGLKSRSPGPMAPSNRLFSQATQKWSGRHPQQLKWPYLLDLMGALFPIPTADVTPSPGSVPSGHFPEWHCHTESLHHP